MNGYTKLQEYMQSLVKELIEENENKTEIESMIEEHIIDMKKPIEKQKKTELGLLLELKENLRKIRLERFIE